MDISCIIPTRNRCAMVLGAIASVLSQERATREIIVVDDGSRDNTVPAVAARYPQVRLITLSGLGPGPARNAGAAEATGDILMFLDSDDCWLPHHTRSLAGVIAKGYSVAYGITRTVDLTTNETFHIPGPDEQWSGDCYEALTRWCFLVPSAVAVTRSAFMDAGGFGTEELGEDWSFFLRLASRHPFGFTDAGGPVSERRLHPGSLCTRTSRSSLLSMVQRKMEIIRKIGGAENHLATLQRMASWLTQAQLQQISVQQWYLAMKKENIL